MTIEELKRDIDNCVENNLLDSILFYAREYTNIMPRQDIITEFFLAATKLCHDVDKYFEEEERDCD